LRTSRADLYSGLAVGPDAVQLCVVRIGATEYAIDLRRVREILPTQRLTPLPAASQWEGLFESRGTVLPVLDLRRQLGVRPSAAPGREKLLVVLIGQRQVGMLVDAVVQVLRTQRSELKPAPSVSEGPYVVGVCGDPPSLKLLLDVKALLSAAVQRNQNGAVTGTRNDAP
jgi:purine-binding chemotaxis protein CheW